MKNYNWAAPTTPAPLPRAAPVRDRGMRGDGFKYLALAGQIRGGCVTLYQIKRARGGE